MTEHYHRALAPVAEPAGDGRTVDVLIMRWDTPAQVTDDSRNFYEESFAPGGLAPAPGARMLVSAFDTGTRGGRHVGGELVGRIVDTHARADGLYGTVRVADTAGGRDLLAMLDPSVGLVEAVSIEFDDDQPSPRAGGRVRRTGARLTGLAFTPYPQHPGSRVLAARSATQEPTMPEPTPEPTPEPAVTPAPEPAPAPTPAARAIPEPTPEPRRADPPRPGRPGNGAARFRSFGHFARAVAMGDITDDERDRYFQSIHAGLRGGHARALEAHARVLADLTTPTQTGVVHDQWIAEVVDLYNIMTPTVQLFSQRPLPESGMTFNVPKVTARGTGPTKQAVQKTEVTSSQKTIGHVPFTVDTYGEGNDISLQLIQRSDPSYVDELMRIFTGWMAEKINTDAVTALSAAADDTHTPLEYTTAATFDELVVDAAALTLGAAGLRRFPEVCLLSVPLWQAIAKVKGTDGRPLYPSVNPMNPVGRIDVTDGDGNIRGLDFAVEPQLTGGVGNIRAIIGVREAFRTYTGPMGTLSADRPANLGRDVAVYQFAAMGAVDTRGLVLVTNAV